MTLTVTDSAGNTDIDTIQIVVDPPLNQPPTASPSATPSSGTAPLSVQFAANAIDLDGDPLSYSWNFRDPSSPDNTSTLENPSHVYANPGTYTASLTVTDGIDPFSTSLMIVVAGFGLPSISVTGLVVLGLALLWVGYWLLAGRPGIVRP